MYNYSPSTIVLPSTTLAIKTPSYHSMEYYNELNILLDQRRAEDKYCLILCADELFSATALRVNWMRDKLYISLDNPDYKDECYLKDVVDTIKLNSLYAVVFIVHSIPKDNVPNTFNIVREMSEPIQDLIDKLHTENSIQTIIVCLDK